MRDRLLIILAACFVLAGQHSNARAGLCAQSIVGF
jgi:hypothetical protein